MKSRTVSLGQKGTKITYSCPNYMHDLFEKHVRCNNVISMYVVYLLFSPPGNTGMYRVGQKTRPPHVKAYIICLHL